MKRWKTGRIPWIEEIHGFSVKFWKSIELDVKNSEALELSVKYRNLLPRCPPLLPAFNAQVLVEQKNPNSTPYWVLIQLIQVWFESPYNTLVTDVRTTCMVCHRWYAVVPKYIFLWLKSIGANPKLSCFRYISSTEVALFWFAWYEMLVQTKIWFLYD